MLRQYTRNDIVYLFSVNDTPPAFVDAVRPLVTEVIPYDDRGITYEIPFKSEYKNFNTLRTCNFIFAYTLDKYDKVCIIESDMVIMKNLDPIFNLKTPAVLTYYIGDRNLKFHDRVRNDRRDVLDKCRDMGRINGGVMVINPSPRLFAEYKAKIVDVVQRNCKYPNETLFEYVNNDYFNLPVQYNLSHYHAQPARLQSYQLDPGDIFVYHFNETDYKHIDIIKNPVDEKGDNWLELIDRQPKYVIRKLPIFHYKRNVFDRYRMVIEPLMIEATRPKVSEAKVVEKPVEKLVSDKVETKPVADKPVAEKVIVNPKIPSPVKKEKCPKGTHRNKKTGLCEPYAKASLPKTESKAKELLPINTKKCPKGTRRNRRTGICEPKIVPLQLEPIQAKHPEVEVKHPEAKQLARCPKGTHRNKKTGECVPNK
jgi:lipopolysaccharide biosynthesis glycosyltransferase